MKRIDTIKWEVKRSSDKTFSGEDEIVECKEDSECHTCHKKINTFKVLFKKIYNNKICIGSIRCLNCYLGYLDTLKYNDDDKNLIIKNKETIIKRIKEDYSDILVLEEI